jgi:ThiF family
MSAGLISRNADLRRLRDEGYQVEISNGYLLIGHIPYVNDKKQVLYGTLISRLELAGDTTVKPNDHVALWAGDYPCDSKGAQMAKIVNNASLSEKIREGLVATYSFSQKPKVDGGYKDYYEKMTTYARMLESEAHVLEPMTTSQTYPVVRLEEEESVFCYLDNASSWAGIVPINEKLKKDRIAIIGLGGSGAYVLDLVAKTSAGEIHLFDGDSFLQHNAFRSPGAPSVDDLTKRPTKVEWYAQVYSRLRRKIIPHPQYIAQGNVAELKPMSFIFLCLDKGAPKQVMANYLVENNIQFVDVGIGLNIQNEALGGLVRVTTCTPSYHNHITRRIPFTDSEDDEYSRNIQIADMNALNAALAVIKWKKLRGFYIDLEHEHNMVYSVSGNLITNDEIGDETKTNQA